MQSILIEFGSRPDLRIWRSNSGAAIWRGKNGSSGGLVRFGVPGQADISGIMRPSGRRIEIEVKTLTGKQSKEQQAWQKMIEWAGGLYILARRIEDVRLALGPSPSEIASPSPTSTRTTLP
jgi:hypothetical protein